MENYDNVNRPQFEEEINKYFIPSQARLIMLAYRLSKYGHRGQERDGGGRYFDHPRAASLILLEQGVVDHEIIIATLLHDLVEDSFILTLDDLEHIFGIRVCMLVKAVTKEQVLPKAEYFPRLLLAPQEAWLVKLADRLHNLATIDSFTPPRRFKYVNETRDKILPLAYKLAEDSNYQELGTWFAEQIETTISQVDLSDK